MKTNFLAKSQEQERKEKLLSDGINLITSKKQLPKLVELAVECSPAFQGAEIRKRIEHAVEVLEKETEPDSLWEATFWEPSKRERVFGTRWELPIRVAWGIVVDLNNGHDVFNPSEEDVRSSKLFDVTVRTYMPEGISPHVFNNGLPECWIKELIERHRSDLAPNREPLNLMSEEEMCENMHPVALELYKESGAQSDPLIKDFYETLSQILKFYKTKEEWTQDSWWSRVKKVPEYLFIGARGQIDLDELIDKKNIFS